MKPANIDPAQSLKSWMRRRFQPGWARAWDSTLRFELSGAKPFCADFLDNSMRLISCRTARQPLAVVHSDPDSLLKILCGALPLELAVMTHRLSTDNMTEVFKFITVFKPDPHTVIIAPEKDPDASPQKRLESQNPLFRKAFFEEWSTLISRQSAISRQFCDVTAATRLVFESNDPRMLLAFKSGKNSITITCPAKSSKVHFHMPFASLHSILSGAQNLMIDLNFKQIAPVDFTDNERKLLEFLINIQPLMSKTYRNLHKDKGLFL